MYVRNIKTIISEYSTEEAIIGEIKSDGESRSQNMRAGQNYSREIF